MRSLYLAVYVVLASSPVASFAQQPPAPQTAAKPSTRAAGLTLQQALQGIFDSHPGVLAAKSRFGAASLQYEAAQYGAFPSLEVDAGRVAGGNAQNTIRLTQPIYAFGRIENTTNAAEKRVDGARDAVLEQVRTLQEQAIGFFYEGLRTRDRLLTAKDNTAAHLRLEESINRRFGAGVGSESDLELAKTRKNQAKNDEAAALAAYRKALTNLRSLLSIEIAELETPKLIRSPYSSENQLLDLAEGASPIIRKLSNEAEALKYDAEVLKASTKPQLVLRAERIESNNPTKFSDTRVIAALQFNPGAGLSAVSNANAGVAKAQAAEQEIAKARRELQEKARGLISDYAQTQDQLVFLESLKTSNSLLVDAFLRQFQAGKRSWLDVLNAQRESTQASLAFVDTFYNAQNFANRMELLAGNAEAIGGTSKIKDLPTQPRLLEALLPSLSAGKNTQNTTKK